MAIRISEFVDNHGMKLLINPATVVAVSEREAFVSSGETKVCTVIECFAGYAYTINLPIDTVKSRLFGAIEPTCGGGIK